MLLGDTLFKYTMLYGQIVKVTNFKDVFPLEN
jgi:hypothetical protein